jgi:hypothetical protein
MVVIAAFVVVVLAATKDGPFHALDGGGTASAQTSTGRPDVQGTWAFLVDYSNSLFAETAKISQENLRTGAYSGTVSSPIGTQVIFGTASASSVSFSIRLGPNVETGTAELSSSGGRLHLTATFANSGGGQGTITATRTSR